MTTAYVRECEFYTRCYARRFFLSAILILLLAVAIPVLADDSVAMVHPAGSVTVNDAAVVRPTPVFVGDRITTGESSTATVISEGTQVAVGANSSIVYMPHEVMVLRNTAVITTLNGMAARTGALKASPDASTPVQYAVVRSDSGTRVTATYGSLSLQNSAQSVRLIAGNSLVFDLASAPNHAGAPLVPPPTNVALDIISDSANWRRKCKPPESPCKPKPCEKTCSCGPPPPPPPHRKWW
jgi:hypothetical protein